MSARGKILSVEDGGSVWQIFYLPEEGGIDRVVFDWFLLTSMRVPRAGVSTTITSSGTGGMSSKIT
jgi:hypothetical protein